MMRQSVSPAALKEQFNLQQQAFYSGKVRPLKNRLEYLKNLKRWIYDHRAEIQNALHKDFGKTAEETDLLEIYPVLSELKKTLAELKYWIRPKRVGFGKIAYLGTRAYTMREPKGNCLIISPWNYPFMLTLKPVIFGIAAGNVLMIKPSEYTPNTTVLLAQMAEEVFGSDIAQVCQGDYQVSSALLELHFDHIYFTGSTTVGQIVMQAATKHLASVTLELGGKSPTIVDESAAIKDAAEKIAWGKWINAGQSCVAPDYVFVHSQVTKKFQEELINAASRLFNQESDQTQVVNKKRFDRLVELQQDAVAKGGNLSFGGDHDAGLLKFRPTIVSEVDHASLAMHEEIFGPLLVTKPYEDLNDVINHINAQPKPLALYVFSSRKKVIQEIAERTSAGSMCVNDTVLQFAHPELPFGGVNHSGIGKSHGYYGFCEFSNEKSVLKQRVGFTSAKTLYPPYNRFKKLMLNLLLKYF